MRSSHGTASFENVISNTFDVLPTRQERYGRSQAEPTSTEGLDCFVLNRNLNVLFQCSSKNGSVLVFVLSSLALLLVVRT